MGTYLKRKIEKSSFLPKGSSERVVKSMNLLGPLADKIFPKEPEDFDEWNTFFKNNLRGMKNIFRKPSNLENLDWSGFKDLNLAEKVDMVLKSIRRFFKILRHVIKILIKVIKSLIKVIFAVLKFVVTNPIALIALILAVSSGVLISAYRESEAADEAQAEHKENETVEGGVSSPVDAVASENKVLFNGSGVLVAIESAYITVADVVKSATAKVRKIENKIANFEHAQNIKRLISKVVNPLKEKFGNNLIITSMYRSPELNAAVGGSATSQHSKGQAVDLQLQGSDNAVYELFNYIYHNLDYDQLILEKNSKGSMWVHVSYSGKNRREVLHYDAKRTIRKYRKARVDDGRIYVENILLYTIPV